MAYVFDTETYGDELLEQFLDETGGAPETEDVFPDTRGLVMSGGKPYILIVVEDPETGGVAVSHAGIDYARISDALRQIADLLDAA
jgi:hypothetical protein